ncbi:MAG: Gfo/Idh/MocA family oxidoreductase [Eubacteriales bacterium]|nr:Gfo/Idh/MocA family oxidoreductase [Eubacteriales bacterium]
MKKEKWRVAVIGCGSFANWQYFPNIEKEAEAVCVAAVDIVEERAREACEKYGIPNHYSSVYDLLKNCDFDIAIDAASIQAHHEINMAILEAGKHLISQKPAAPDVESMSRQIEAAKKSGVQFSCVPIHPMRYDIAAARQMMRDGTIGNFYYIKVNASHGGPEYFQYRDADPSWFFEPGAGALVDMGVHGLQMATALFGPARKVACMAKVTIPVRYVRTGCYDGKKIESNQIPDQYVITLDFGNEKMGLVDTGFSEKATKAPQIEIFGDLGTISFTRPYMENQLPEVYLDCPEKGVRGWMDPMPWLKPADLLKSQCCCLKDLIEAIKEKRMPILSAEHARHVLEIMCKIPEAIRTGTWEELSTVF